MTSSYDPQALNQRNLRGSRILLIEDNPDHCEVIRKVLQACMPEVELIITSTGEEAMKYLHQCVEARRPLPRLILLDLYLPGREEGLALLKELKDSASPFRFIPLTLLTQSERVEDTQMGYNLGANSYIVKPLDFSQWLTYFTTLRQYWWCTVTLPPA